MSWKKVGNALKKVAGVAAPIVGGIVAGPLGAAAGGALGGALRGGGVKGALTGAAIGGIGAGALNKVPGVSRLGSAATSLGNKTIGKGATTALSNVALNRVGGAKPAAGAAIGQPSDLDNIMGLIGNNMPKQGVMDRIKGALGSITGNPDTMRTAVGAAGAGLGALQQQRQFEAAQKLRERQLNDDILTSGQSRRVSEDERLRKDAEFQRMKRQDQMYSPQRGQIVSNLMSRLGMGGGGLS
jgi:hypothetical protein